MARPARVLTGSKTTIAIAAMLLSDVARFQVVQCPPMLRSENARMSGRVYVDIRGLDLRSAVQDIQTAVARTVLGAGHLKLKGVVPFTLLIIFVLCLWVPIWQKASRTGSK